MSQQPPFATIYPGSQGAVLNPFGAGANDALPPIVYPGFPGFPGFIIGATGATGPAGPASGATGAVTGVVPAVPNTLLLRDSLGGGQLTSLAVNTNGVSKSGALSVLSGGTTNFTSIEIGRTGPDADIGIAAAAAQYVSDSQPGDLIVRGNNGTIRFGLGTGNSSLQVFTSTTTPTPTTGAVVVHGGFTVVSGPIYAPSMGLFSNSTNAPAIFTAYTGNNANYSSIRLGRLTQDLEIGAVAGPNQFITGSAQGDVTFTNNNNLERILFGVNNGGTTAISVAIMTSGTASNSTTTGALTVTGGAGVSGSLYANKFFGPLTGDVTGSASTFSTPLVGAVTGGQNGTNTVIAPGAVSGGSGGQIAANSITGGEIAAGTITNAELATPYIISTFTVNGVDGPINWQVQAPTNAVMAYITLVGAGGLGVEASTGSGGAGGGGGAFLRFPINLQSGFSSSGSLTGTVGIPGGSQGPPLDTTATICNLDAFNLIASGGRNGSIGTGVGIGGGAGGSTIIAITGAVPSSTTLAGGLGGSNSSNANAGNGLVGSNNQYSGGGGGGYNNLAIDIAPDLAFGGACANQPVSIGDFGGPGAGGGASALYPGAAGGTLGNTRYWGSGGASGHGNGQAGFGYVNIIFTSA